MPKYMTDATEFEDAATACYDKAKHFFEMAADLAAYYLACPFVADSAGTCRAYAERGMGSPLLFAGGIAVGILIFATIVFVIRAYVDAVRVRRRSKEKGEEILRPRAEEDEETERESEEDVIMTQQQQKVFRRASFVSSRAPYIVRPAKNEDLEPTDDPEEEEEEEEIYSPPPPPPPARQRRHRLAADVHRLRADPCCYVLQERFRSTTIKKRTTNKTSSRSTDP